jgi:octaprenyl-diphosphate synthase
MKPQELFPALTDDLAEVDRVIRTRLASEVVLVNTVAEYIVAAGGKRLRPALLLLVARALDYRGPHHHLLAAVIEFIHTATLLHDDVVDESELRRGRKTANAAFGNAASVLVGDFLYSRAFQMMVEADDMRVMRVLSDATNVIAEGEVLQLINCNDPDVDEERYLKVIRYKTARLFEAAAQIGAILAGASPALEQGAAEYGRRLGTAFQLIDDLLDYSGVTADIGKNVGDDLREGKPTLPLIHVMSHGSAFERNLVREAIVDGQTERYAEIMAAIERTGALEYTRMRALEEARAAADAIAGLPASGFKDALLYLSTHSVQRDR